MLVRTLKAHRNDWGEPREKAVGDCYELPEAELAALEGIVEPVLRQAQDERASDAPAKTKRGSAKPGGMDALSEAAPNISPGAPTPPQADGKEA